MHRAGRAVQLFGRTCSPELELNHRVVKMIRAHESKSTLLMVELFDRKRSGGLVI